jgi:hypothetical protein
MPRPPRSTKEAEKSISGFLGSPPREDQPVGFNSFEISASDLLSPSPPKGRGRERNRPGLLKLSASDQQAIADITRTMNAYMLQFAHNMGKCMAAQLRHLAGMLCMGCDPEWQSWVSTSPSSITVDISDESCTSLTASCIDYVREAQDLPKLVENMRTAIQAIITAAIDAGTISQADVPTEDLTQVTKASNQVAHVCGTDAECRAYICEVLSKGQAGVSPDPNTVSDPASVAVSPVNSEIELSISVTYRVSSSGYDSVGLGTAAASSSETTTPSIDGVSATDSPLEMNTGAVYLAGGLLVLAF